VILSATWPCFIFPTGPPLALTIVVEYPPVQEEATCLIGMLAGQIVKALADKD